VAKRRSGLTPFSSAATSTNGLKALPGWRRPCDARLNCDAAKSRPPTMATMPPVYGSMHTSAASGSPLALRKAATAPSAFDWRAGSRVVYTRRPPVNTVEAPSLSIRSCFTYSTKYGATFATSCGGATVIDVARAATSCSDPMRPTSRMRVSTSLRRARAATGYVRGE